MIGVAAKKIGMSRLYMENNRAAPVTLVKVYEACVFDVKNNEDSDRDTVVVSFDKAAKVRKVNKSVKGACEKKGLAVYKKFRGFKVEKGVECKVGDEVGLKQLKVGDFVDVSGVSIGKGFAGGMKRHGFGGLEATHGVSISHRSHGSTGQCQDPGRVFKGKKMAGQMGGVGVTVKNLEILWIDEEEGVVGIKGAIPGSKGGDVFLKSSAF